MSTRKAKCVVPLSRPPSPGTDPAFDGFAQMLAVAVVTESERAVEGALAVLEDAGLYRPAARQRPLPLPFLLKLAACLRLHQWEEAKLVRHLRAGLPSAADAWDDFLTDHRSDRERFPARELASHVFGTWLGQMAWAPPSPAADVVVSGICGGGDAEDELAELLFKFRHLAEQRRRVPPEED